jgi:hypothetical protein
VSKDISRILAGWEHEPEQLSVRIITGDDGRDKIQMRLDLGLLQMELDGRPDGQRPEGRESWLEFYEEQQAQSRDSHEDFSLSTEDCERLLREGVQYYHRYLSFWHLSRYDLCARDTQRNLRLFAFVRLHARHERDKLQFDQWRPYVTMMYTRASATPLVERGELDAALVQIEEGISQIEEFLEEYQQQDRQTECFELQFLRRWRKEVVSRQTPKPQPPPADPLMRLHQRLAEAIAAERYEEAARLRDEIRKLTAPSESS